MRTMTFWCRLLTALTLVTCSVSCSDSQKRQRQVEEHPFLFTKLPSSKTGIGFKNEIPESSFLNSMVYEYFYNGGGVAIGDIDNDGLPDIYFTANLKENKLYRNKGDLKFEDITKKAKTEGTFGWSTGVTMADVNADGWLDIYVCKSGKGKPKDRKNLLYINNKNGTFSEKAAEFGLDFEGYSTQANFFDYDKDGDLDLFLLNHNVTPVNTNNPEKFKEENNAMVGDQLYRNEGGKFVNVSKKAGILGNSLGFGLGVSVGDLNQDGWPDIYVANDYIEQDYLYYNNGDGTFTEKLKSSLGHVSNFSMGTDIADFNNDGLLDVMTLDMVAEDNYGIKTSMSGMDPKAFNHSVAHGFHYQYMYNTLQMNNENGHFSDIAQLAKVSSTDWSWGPLFADFDNDGLKDLFVSNGLKRDFRNNDFRKFKLKRLEEAQRTGEKMSDVVEELVAKTPPRSTLNYFFKNNGDLTFSKMSKDWGLTKPSFSNGAAYADLDRDGDLDLVINNIDEEASVLRNNSSNNFLQLSFKGNSKNPFGVGAHVALKTKKGIQVLENYPTRGYQSSVEPQLHIGLANLETVDTLEVRWSDGKVQFLKDVSANQKIVVDYADAFLPKSKKEKPVLRVFKDVTEAHGIQHLHQENEYDDFTRESLLPHKMSQFGPALATGDVNNDGLDDFFVGGAKGYPGALYTQNTNGSFTSTQKPIWQQDKGHEDTDAVFFDADNDGDLDLFVVSGGNEWVANHSKYQDRLYLNVNGDFKRESNSLPNRKFSGSCVKPFDFDGDGDMDLFVGSRLFPQKYPHSQSSILLENLNGKFEDVTAKKAPELQNVGMVTDALWTDFDNDGQQDLIVVGEWTAINFFKNRNGSFQKLPNLIEDSQGWWNSIEGADFDGDGDMDYVVGNLGNNYKYKASPQAPFEVYATDFDDNGTNDIVLGYYDQGSLFPLRGRECSSNQMPFIKEKFPTYHSFGSANLLQVYGKEKLEKALHLKASTFSSVYLENLGGTQFAIHHLPNAAQLSSINDMVISDFDRDGHQDVLVAGNLYQSEVETPRNDASIGMLLKGSGSSVFRAEPYSKSGVFLKGDIKKMRPILLGTDKTMGILVAENNGYLKLISAH